MVLATSPGLFTATAATAGSLTGLLFVAMSVAPRRAGRVAGPDVIRQVRAGAALISFSNVLAVSLFSLVPTTNSGYPAVVLSVIGVLYTAAAIRSIRSSRATRRQLFGQFELMSLLFVIFGAELISGIVLILHPSSRTALEYIGYSLVASLLLGVARAWELVGDRDTGIFASIAVLTGRSAGVDPAAGAREDSESTNGEHW